MKTCIPFIFCLAILIFCNLELVSKESPYSQIDSLKRELNNSELHDTLKIKCYQQLSMKYYKIDPDSGVMYGKKGLKLSEQLNYPKGKAECLNAIGVNFWIRSDYVNSFKYFLNTVKNYSDIFDSLGLAGIYNNLSLIYGQIGYVEKSCEYLQKAIVINKALKNHEGLAINYINLASLHKELKEYQKVLQNLDLANQINLETQKKIHLQEEILYFNYADAYIDIKKFDNAKKYIDIANKFLENSNDDFSKKMILFEESRLKLEYLLDTTAGKISIPAYKNSSEILKSSIKGLIEVKDLFEKNSQNDYLPYVYNMLSKGYKMLNDYKNSLKYSEKYISFTDSIQKTNNLLRIGIIGAEREIALKEKDIQLSKLQVKTYLIVTISAISVAVIFFIALIATILLLRNKRKQNILLEEKSKIIHDSNEELKLLLNNLSEKQNEIEEANEKLDKANSDKDKFFSIISHDLRTPFTGIIGLSDLIAKESSKLTKEEIASIASSIHVSTKETYYLLNDLLDWSRNQMGAVQCIPTKINIHHAFESSVKSIINTAEIKKISIINDIPEHIYGISDHPMLLTIFRNLVSNAIKFTNTGGEVIAYAKEINEHIEISIKDSGIGMEKEKLEKIFDFNQIITTSGTRNERGTGLGLNLCKDFVTANKGNIWAETSPGDGSIFYFSLPKAD